jgi:hypothetical protein
MLAVMAPVASFASCVIPPGKSASRVVSLNVLRCLRVSLTNDFVGNYSREGEQIVLRKNQAQASTVAGSSIQGMLVTGDPVVPGVTPSRDITTAIGGGSMMLFIPNTKPEWACPDKIPQVLRFEVELRCCDSGPAGECMLPGGIAVGIPAEK